MLIVPSGSFFHAQTHVSVDITEELSPNVRMISNILDKYSGRRSAYGYRYTEAFLSQLAQAGGAERLTDALARWTTQLWYAPKDLDGVNGTITEKCTRVK